MTTLRLLVLASAFPLLETTAWAAISGRVVSVDGAPVGRATIEAFPPEMAQARALRLVQGRARAPLASARSAPDGSFQLEAPAGAVDLRARADGFAPAFEVAAGADHPTLVLRRAQTRRGVIVANGKPVPSAVVVWIGGTARGDGTGELLLTTGPDGSYELADPDAWAASLLVFHPDYAPVQGDSGGPKWPTPLSHSLSPGVPIEGTVVDDTTGRGVAGATLWVEGWPVGKSSSQGSFRIPHAPPAWSAVVATTRALAGQAKPGAGKIVISAQPARSLSGFVRDAQTGEPLRGAIVSVQSESSGMTSTAMTDARGWYSVPSLTAERLLVLAALQGYSTRSTSDRPDEWTVDLRKRTSGQRDFTLARNRRLVGRVQDEDGKPVADAMVTLGSVGEPNIYLLGDGLQAPRPIATSGHDGTFVLDAGPDDRPSACVVALKDGYAAGRSGGVDVGGEPLEPLVVALPRGIELRGHVATADGAPLPDVAIALAEDGILRENEMPVSIVLARFAGPGWTRTDAEGRFVTRVRPAIHNLAFYKSGFVPRVVQRVEATPGSVIEVVLNPAAEIRGRVLRSDGTGVPAVSVNADGRGLAGRQSQATTTDDGAFVLPDLAPGRYDLYVSKEQTAIGERRVVEAPASDVLFELKPGGTLRGRAFDAKSHEPIQRFSLSLDRVSDEEVGPAAAGAPLPVSDPGGAFAVTDVPAGEWSVTALAEGYPTRTLEGVFVAADSDGPSLELAMDKGIVVRGHVATKGGEPLSDAQVTVGGRSGSQDLSAESDENGEFELAGLSPGTVRLEFHHDGYLSELRTLDAAQSGPLEVVLSRGLSAKGVVVSSGVGVANASVEATSRVANAPRQEAATDKDGRFTIEGLAPGRYSFEAAVDGKGEAKLEDVDVTAGAALRLELQQGETAILSGTLTGLPENDDLVLRAVTAVGDDGKTANAIADSMGRFRMENAPAGRVKVRAYARSFSGSSLSSRTKELTLAAGSESQTILEFRSDISITGTVTRRGEPLPDALVSFRTADGNEDTQTQTGANGAYEVLGIEPGPHGVQVFERGSMLYETEYVVAGSAQFDIDATGAAIRGQVVDAATREPLAGVDVSFWLLGGHENEPATSVTTNTRGQFSATALRDAPYRLLTAKEGYGQETREVDLARGATAEAVFELVLAEGLRVRVSDARDGRPLDAIVVARDPARRIVANRHSDPGDDGVFTIALGSGPYLLSASASGYGTQTMPVTAPGQGIPVTLTPGGTLVVESNRDLDGRIRLVQPDGEEYVRCWCNGIADIEVKGRRTIVTNITPGSYAVELVDSQGAVSGAGSVSIGEGQTTTLRIE